MNSGSCFRDMLLVFVVATVATGAYFLTLNLLQQISLNPAAPELLPGKILSLSCLFFFILLFFSSFVGALGHFYTSSDLPLLLALPISNFRLFISRFIETSLKASWMFLLLCVPTLLAYKTAFGLPVTFLVEALALLIPFIVIPCGLSAILVTVAVNLIPTDKLKEALTGIFAIITLAFFYLGQKIPMQVSASDKGFDSIQLLNQISTPHPIWLPSRWIVELISRHFQQSQYQAEGMVILLIASTVTTIALGLILFDRYFYRGWNKANQSSSNSQIRSVKLSRLLRFCLPLRPQFRAFLYKEARILLRDPTQSLQLLMLLLLTLLYLYNFRSLRSVSNLSFEAAAWWKALLAASNIVLSGCVVAAISTRFVYPAVSMEGRTYSLLRVAPVSMAGFLNRKFIIWLIPMSIIGVTLAVSGALAIQVNPISVLVSGILAFGLTAGIVGMGIGTGAVYAIFDWDNPTQIASGFGSLIYMGLCFALLSLSLLPATFLLVMVSVDTFATSLPKFHYLMTVFCFTFLLFFTNLLVVRKSLKVGEEALLALEN